MATVYAHTNDGYVGITNSDWRTARDAVGGTVSGSTGNLATVAVTTSLAATRGGGSSFQIYRSFFFFDVSDIITNVASATLKIRGVTYGDGDIIAVKSTSDIESLGGFDFNEIEGWSASPAADGSGQGDHEDDVTKYSDEIDSWSTSGYNDIALNSTALADMRNDGKLYICLMNYDHDLKDIEPTGNNRNGMYYTNYTGTSRDPYIDYTLVSDTTDGILFGANF